MKKVFLILVIVILVTGFAAAKLYKPEEKPAENTTREQPAVSALEQAAASGGNYWCSFKNSSDQGSGIIYMSANKFRADYKSKDDIQVHMAFDGNWYYAWGGGSPPFKIPADQVKRDGAVQTPQQAIVAAVGTQTTGEVNCLPWTVDQSLLSAPTATEFADLSENFRALREATGSGTPGSGR